VNGHLAAAVRATGLRRRHLAAARVRAQRRFLSRFASRSVTDRARILCYHAVGTPGWGVNDLTPYSFRQQLELALAEGYKFVTLKDAVRQGAPHTLSVTFDDGLTSVATNAAPILVELGIPFTIFVVSDWADGRHAFGDGVIMSWQELRRLVDSGAAIGSHSVTHPNFARLSSDTAAFELRSSREQIATYLGVAPDEFAIPFGRSSDWTAESSILAGRAGYTKIFAQAENTRPAGTIPRTFVTRWDDRPIFRAAIDGAFDNWQE
jgi:peptidoglycan/xylan/chitin deacetylase (PgdA/CDA1 family)